jgi:hypothetical protein
MGHTYYNSYKQKTLDGSINLAQDIIKLALVSDFYIPDHKKHERWSDIKNEIDGVGYRRGGAELVNKRFIKDDENNRGIFVADPVVWPSSTITARGAILYTDKGWLIRHLDFGENKVSKNGDFIIEWGTDGIVNMV